MSLFAEIAVRTNGQDILADWFNALRLAGVNVEGMFGPNFITQTSFDLPTSQVSPTNLTGIIFDKLVVQSARVAWSVTRKNGVSSLLETGEFLVHYRPENDTWETSDVNSGGDDALLVFSIVDSTGQIQYTLGDMSPTQTSAKLRIQATTFAI